MESAVLQGPEQGDTVVAHQGWHLRPRTGLVMRIVPANRIEPETAQIAWEDGQIGFAPTWSLHLYDEVRESPGYLRRAARNFDQWRFAYVPGRVAKAAWAVAWGLGRSLKVFLGYLLSAYVAGHFLFSISASPLRQGPFGPVLELLVGAMLLAPLMLVWVVLVSIRDFGNKAEKE